MVLSFARYLFILFFSLEPVCISKRNALLRDIQNITSDYQESCHEKARFSLYISERQVNVCFTL